MNIGEFSRLDHRMHNKIIIADNRAAIIGGRNIADEYFGSHRDANFRDMEVLTYGPSIESLSDNFDDFWNSRWSIPVDRILNQPLSEKQPTVFLPQLEKTVPLGLEESRPTRLNMWLSAARSGVHGEASIISDEPARENPGDADEMPDQLARKLVNWIDQSKEELIIVTAYLVPTPTFEEAIERAEKRGVQVRILTNSLGCSFSHLPFRINVFIN